jgi:hypothetical protein
LKATDHCRFSPEDAPLVDVGVVFWVEAFYFRMEGCVGHVADNRVSKVGPFLSVPLHISDIDWNLKELLMKRAALYMRVSTLDQHPET